MTKPTVYEFVGGEEAFLALATAFHARCLADPVLEHPFSHPGHPDHVARLGHYWAEVFGGPVTYPEGHTGMLDVHAGQGADHDLHQRFLACFVAAADDAGWPDDPELRAALQSYMEYAVAEVESYAPHGSTVPSSLPTPRWSWDGLQR